MASTSSCPFARFAVPEHERLSVPVWVCRNQPAHACAPGLPRLRQRHLRWLHRPPGPREQRLSRRCRRPGAHLQHPCHRPGRLLCCCSQHCNRGAVQWGSRAHVLRQGGCCILWAVQWQPRGYFSFGRGWYAPSPPPIHKHMKLCRIAVTRHGALSTARCQHQIQCFGRFISAMAATSNLCMHAGVNPTFNYMANTFGFTQRETVAIMGAHSLGEAKCAPQDAVSLSCFMHSHAACSSVQAFGRIHAWSAPCLVGSIPGRLGNVMDECKGRCCTYKLYHTVTRTICAALTTQALMALGLAIRTTWTMPSTRCDAPAPVLACPELRSPLPRIQQLACFILLLQFVASNVASKG